MDTLDWINIVVGVIGLLLALVSIFYSVRAAHEATKAAESASTLLTRLVVYPFRELDGNYATLTDNEAEVLLRIFELSKLRKSPLTLAQVRENMPSGARIPQGSLELLAERGWLTKQPSGFGLNPERGPYLTFREHVKNGDTH